MPYIFKVGKIEIKVPKWNEMTWSHISGKPSTYTPSSHNHTYLLDRYNGTMTYLNYGADGLTSATWLAAWNGYELRAISPENMKNILGLADTGWVNCSYGSGMLAYGSIPLQVRRIGKIVHLRGVVKNANAFTPTSDTSHILGYIPSGYNPSKEESFIMQGSGSNRWLMSIRTNGTINISRYSDDTTTHSQVNAGSWLNCFATWFID